jgi:2,3-dihydroxybiphenyl 1,2-dioxygenase
MASPTTHLLNGRPQVHELRSLGYVVFGVSDLDRWEHFAVDLIGFQVARRSKGQELTLRMDAFEQRVVLEQGSDDDLRAAGWQLESLTALEEYVARLRDRGIAVERGAQALTRARRVERVYLCEDPNGFTHEFFAGPAVADVTRPFRSRVLSGPGFRTGDLGVGHLLPLAKDYAATVAFYRDKLGLAVSDFIREEIAPGVVADATFFHSATGRHHCIATAAMPGTKRLNHFMVEVQDLDDVGLAYDRCLRAGYPMVMELGRHPNDRMFSFYVETPSGFALELGCGGLVIDRTAWEVVTYSRMSEWGHKRRPPIEAPA